MNLNEISKILNYLAASDSKVQVWMLLDGQAVELEQDRKPIRAADALVAVKAAHDTATDFGKTPEFGVNRWEAWTA
jgi:hypothetical protein